MHHDLKTIKSWVKDSTLPILAEMGVEIKRGRGYCPICQPNGGKTPDFSVKGAALRCFKCSWKGDIIALYMTTRGVGFVETIDQITKGKFEKAIRTSVPVRLEPKRRYFGSHREAIEAVAGGWDIMGVWEYREMDGSPHMVVYRIEKGEKSYRPISWSPDGWFIGKAKGKLPIYNLPKITNSFDDVVCVVEGEKSADAGTWLGLLTTTSAGGASGADGSDWQPLNGRRLILIPDNDEAGERYIQDVIKLAQPSSYEILRLGGGPKYDLFDFVQERAGQGKEALLQQLRDIYKQQKGKP